jgi:hypothetical protein
MGYIYPLIYILPGSDSWFSRIQIYLYSSYFAFRLLLSAPVVNPKINIWIKKIYIAEDKQIIEIAQEMKEDRKIEKICHDFKSGKVIIVKIGGEEVLIEDEEQILALELNLSV